VLERAILTYSDCLQGLCAFDSQHQQLLHMRSYSTVSKAR
jgi:hypothetical protein